MKRLLFIVLTVIAPITASAQEIIENKEDTIAKEKVSATIGVDLVSQYIWRGQDLGNVSFQPALSVGYKGLNLSAWGSVGISNWADTKELDFTLDYSYKGFNIGVTDYWFSTGSYFQYKNGKTTHIWEGFVGYDFKIISAKWYTNLFGNDGAKSKGKRAYSSYFELAVPFRLATLEWAASIGVVPWRTTFYGNENFAVTNVSLRATKDFIIKEKYHIPIYIDLIANPDSKRLYLLFGLSFKI